MYYNDLFAEMDALFNEDSLSSKVEKYSVPQFPPCEMIKLKDGTLKLNFALAKYKKSDISISTEENRVVVSTISDYKKPELPEGARVLAGGIKAPAFKNSFIVPETKFDFTSIMATFTDGILEITIPPKEKKIYSSITISDGTETNS